MNNLETILSGDEEFVICTKEQIEKVFEEWEKVVVQFPIGKPPKFSADHFLRILEETVE